MSRLTKVGICIVVAVIVGVIAQCIGYVGWIFALIAGSGMLKIFGFNGKNSVLFGRE